MDLIDNVSSQVKRAVTVVKIKERKYHLKERKLLIKMMKKKYIQQQCKVATLVERVMHSQKSSNSLSKESKTQQSKTHEQDSDSNEHKLTTQQ